MSEGLDSALRAAVAAAIREELPAALRQALAEVRPAPQPDADAYLDPRGLARLLGCSLSKARELMSPRGPLAPFVAALPSDGSGQRRQRRIGRSAALGWLETQRRQG